MRSVPQTWAYSPAAREHPVKETEEPMEAKTIGIVGITAEGASLCYRTIVSESAKLLPGGAHPRSPCTPAHSLS